VHITRLTLRATSVKHRVGGRTHTSKNYKSCLLICSVLDDVLRINRVQVTDWRTIMYSYVRGTTVLPVDTLLLTLNTVLSHPSSHCIGGRKDSFRTLVVNSNVDKMDTRWKC